MGDIHDVTCRVRTEDSLAERYAAQVARSRELAALRRRKRVGWLAGGLLLVSALCVLMRLFA